MYFFRKPWKRSTIGKGELGASVKKVNRERSKELRELVLSSRGSYSGTRTG